MAAFAAAHHDERRGAALARQALGAARELGNPTCLAWALSALGAASSESDPVAARDALEEGVALAAMTSNQAVLGVARPRLAALRSGGDGQTSRALLDELEEWQRRANRSHASELLARSIPVLATSGRHRAVAQLFGAVGSLAGFGLQLPAERRRIERAIDEARSVLGEGSFAEHAAEGAALPFDGVVEIAGAALEDIADLR